MERCERISFNMLLKLRNLVLKIPVRNVGDNSIHPYSFGALLPAKVERVYPRPPPREEYLKKEEMERYLEPKPMSTILDEGYYADLPDSYRKFYIEWKLTTPSPVHFYPQPGKYYKDPKTGQVTPVQNVPIPLQECEQEDDGIWGGESVIQGWVRMYAGKTVLHDVGPGPKVWYPRFRKTVVYSEILDKYMSCVVTRRTIALINENCGLDHYLLKSRACDLRNLLAVRMKRKLLHTLHHKSLYSDDETRREEVYNIYKHYLEGYTPEEIEWYGLTLEEARRKMEDIQFEAEQKRYVPMKYQFRKEFIEYLQSDDSPLKKKDDTPWYKKKLLDFK